MKHSTVLGEFPLEFSIPSDLLFAQKRGMRKKPSSMAGAATLEARFPGKTIPIWTKIFFQTVGLLKPPATWLMEVCDFFAPTHSQNPFAFEAQDVQGWVGLEDGTGDTLTDVDRMCWESQNPCG